MRERMRARANDLIQLIELYVCAVVVIVVTSPKFCQMSNVKNGRWGLSYDFVSNTYGQNSFFNFVYRFLIY